jgi:hypothetical protein
VVWNIFGKLLDNLSLSLSKWIFVGMELVMCNKISMSTFIVVLLLSFGSLATTYCVLNQIPKIINEASPSNISFENLIEDPKIDQEPEVTINGTSDEFSSSYHPVSVDTNTSYIELMWNHTQNTKLDYVGVDPLHIFPDYNDFIYMYQEFEWPYEEMPKDGEMSFNLSTFLTGDFELGVQPLNNLMFRVYVWVIDSSGNWVRLYESREATYTEMIQEKRVNLNYFNLNDIFDGMVEEDGVQEDPTDSAKMAIGLAPSYRFESFQETEPWTFYNGTVSIRISSMEFTTIREIEPDPETHLVPLFNETYGTVFSDVYPEATSNETAPMTERLYAMTSDPEGNVYLTGETTIDYELYMQTGISLSNQFLIKYGSSLDEKWVVKNNNMSRGRAITYHEGYIYTTGCYYYYNNETNYRDVMVTKWTASGQKVWETEWGGLNDQVGVGIGVHNDGSIYVMVSDYNTRGPEISDCYDNTTLLKFDNSGTLIWNRSILSLIWRDRPGEMRVYDSQIFYSISGIFEFLDLDGNMIRWNNTGYAVSDDVGAVYTAKDRIEYLEVTKFDSSGMQIWNESCQIEYPNEETEWLVPIDIALTPSEEILILAQAQHYDNSYFLIKYSSEGELMQTWSIGDENWPSYGQFVSYIEASSTGRLYCAFSFTGDVEIYCYALADVGGLGVLQDILLLAAVGGGVAAVVIIGVYVLKKRKS